ncbi:putative porin [Alteromonas sp. ASW11-36]|uniref:Porin n=1 Tax=Alteromonas arenosi TaxID=3055817 RepID=A0ABT7STD6_9ALTE|nr:putative porin [Alteromonas sp. ASW11-36]MDM7859249.1 putative porin [Alteromonas sp. ASW11-36]
MKYTSLLSLSLLAFNFSAYADETINHEFSMGFSDIRSANDQFIGVNYRYYLQPVSIDDQAYRISPYMQRTDNVNASYFGIADLDFYSLGGEWFLDNDWNIRANYQYFGDDFEDVHGLSLETGHFVSEHWEVGAGISALFIDDDFNNSDEYSGTVFARYVSFDRGAQNFNPGWDIVFRAIAGDDDDALEISANYYMRKNWSISLDIINQDNFSGDSTTIAEIGTDYWFNEHASIQFGLGMDVDESVLGSATLLGTFRF